jgi:hypothetical protein
MARGEQPLVLESLERRIKGADGVVAPGSRSEIALDRQAVSLVSKAHDAEQRGKFERAEACRRHYYQVVEQIADPQASVARVAILFAPTPESMHEYDAASGGGRSDPASPSSRHRSNDRRNSGARVEPFHRQVDVRRNGAEVQVHARSTG